MTLRLILEEAKRRRKSIDYYAPEEGDLLAQFDARNVAVEFHELPSGGPDPFVTVSEEGEFLGAITVENLRAFLWPPIRHPHEVADLSPEYRALFELLDDTVFASLSRRQLLATSREFEERAWRTGHGTLHVGFQSASAFRDQRSIYRQMAAETDIDIHIYYRDGDAEGGGDDDSGLTVHTDGGGDVGRYWFIVFDGDGRKNALVAEQRTDDSYYGVWTYDAELVEAALDGLG